MLFKNPNNLVLHTTQRYLIFTAVVIFLESFKNIYIALLRGFKKSATILYNSFLYYALPGGVIALVLQNMKHGYGLFLAIIFAVSLSVFVNANALLENFKEKT